VAVVDVSIIIPVLNKLEFTRLCLDRIWRNTDRSIDLELVVVDNASTDGTADWFADTSRFPRPVRYIRHSENVGYARANNAGARVARGEYLLFLNNDTLPQPGWLAAMLRAAQHDKAIGIVGIKQLFPYTNLIYHTGIVFDSDGMPQHLYPHLDASLPQVNVEREYQAVTGACLMIRRSVFEECGAFDEGYLNGYEDVDLCLTARERGYKVVCCTSAFIYHYGQISEGRTSDDDRNAARFRGRWSSRVRKDRDEYQLRDGFAKMRRGPAHPSGPRRLPADAIYLADDLGQGSALTWMNAELALALADRGVPVFVNGARLSPTLPAPMRRRLAELSMADVPVGGIQIKWSHYRAEHLNRELAGDVNLEFFVINYQFERPGSDPWDYWLQSLRQTDSDKLPLSGFCKYVLEQIGVPDARCHVLGPGYSPEIDRVEAPGRRDSSFRLLTVTNSHDLGRYGTLSLIEAYQRAFSRHDEVVLVVKDYGASSGNSTLQKVIGSRADGPRIEYVHQFTDKTELIRLYKSCDGFVSAHRGEGFGMKILDAMACGLPVITPLFGGPTEYCTRENCLPVEFSLVPMADCLDAECLQITNGPLWAEPDVESLAARMRELVEHRDRAAAIAARGRETVAGRYTWSESARTLCEIAADTRAARPAAARAPRRDAPTKTERSPYWLGLRVSVVVPTHNRKEKLLACLASLARQSILPNEFEVIVVDDGSTDGTREAVAGLRLPFQLRYCRQENAGPGAARNRGIDEAAGELVLFVGDDIYADERLLEEHLLAHAANGEPGAAVLGHIDWPEGMPINPVMKYVCGSAMLQFAYSYIPTAPALDHRFFYTSNISLKRAFLVEAAEAGIRFDPAFSRAAFEDSEFAYRLQARGLQIHYAARARAVHDHPMDLDSFAGREFRAGEMAVVFYRKHPAEDDQLQVRWIADLVEPVNALMRQPELLRHLEAFDRQTDTMLRATAASTDRLLTISEQLEKGIPVGLSADHLRSGLDNVFKSIFDVERSRGKIREWYGTVTDDAKVRAAQSLGAVLRKLEFLQAAPGTMSAASGTALQLDRRLVATLGGPSGNLGARRPPSARLAGWAPRVVPRLVAPDRSIQARLQAANRLAWLHRYQQLRSRLRRALL
jgi:GT2 family glycosyltransferase/glycosyltransferase involved in cell wall biosynthesis